MADLPPEIEICTRLLDGHACGHPIFRALPQLPYCRRCGSKEGGVLYVPKSVVVHVDTLEVRG